MKDGLLRRAILRVIDLADPSSARRPRPTPPAAAPAPRTQPSPPPAPPEPELAPVPAGSVLDIRAVRPRERHPLIFRSFAALGKGEGFELVNDHDPVPLYYHFQNDLAGQFAWEVLENGPETWRVRISKAA